MPFLSILISGLSSFFTGLFGFKGDQAKTIQTAMEMVGKLNDADAQSIAASANAISTILTQGSWIERTWRPILMILLMVIIGSWFFGYAPPNFDKPLSPMMDQVIELLKVGVMGYIPCRTLEKVMTQINLGSILKTFIEKKLS
jgi:hypothetical protein